MRLAEGVTRSRIIARNGKAKTIRLRITPTANRNSYRVARLVGGIPRVACFARNPGLGKRNSYRVAAAYVCFVMEGIMFVCMDVGISAGAHPSISHRHAPHDDSIPLGSKSGLRP